MQHPLSHYFIAASFNTYLVEDQIKGPSSVDGYISALKRCCRFIELDVWEPDEESEKHEPIIYHGGTQTSKLALSAALTIINDLAFEKSSYPLFIRLEHHLSLKWQQYLVDSLLTYFGTKLYLPFKDSIDWTLPENPPTPEKFKNKILLVVRSLFDRKDLNLSRETIFAGKSTPSSKSKQKLGCWGSRGRG